MGHRFDTEASADGLIAYIDASPSPFHAVEQAARLLIAGGFTEVAERDATPTEPGRYLTRRGGSLVAWSTETSAGAATRFRVVGAHTDSPNLRIKPNPDHARSGWHMLGVEVYGGALVNSWLDRDLGLSGRVAVRDGEAPNGVRGALLQVDEPLLRVSQLAPHLDRSVHTDGLKLNAQQHLVPHWAPVVGADPAEVPSFARFVAERVGVDEADVLGWDVMTHDLTPSRRTGLHGETIAAPRTDNLATSYAGVQALLDAVAHPAAEPCVPVLVLFDHEEVGSMSERGAFSQLLPTWLERIVAAQGGTREDLHRAIAGTVIASGDMAHATHPNYGDRHEPQHTIRMNGGPVLKINTNLRYATDSVGAAAFVLACEQADVPVQEFVTRSDLPCGSTVGPMTSALTGATTVDFGAPTLSMHSVRELVGTRDQAMYAGALAAFLSPA